MLFLFGCGILESEDEDKGECTCANNWCELQDCGYFGPEPIACGGPKTIPIAEESTNLEAIELFSSQEQLSGVTSPAKRPWQISEDNGAYTLSVDEDQYALVFDDAEYYWLIKQSEIDDKIVGEFKITTTIAGNAFDEESCEQTGFNFEIQIEGQNESYVSPDKTKYSI